MKKTPRMIELEKEYENLYEEMVEEIKRQITDICDKKNWDFHSFNTIYVTKRGTNTIIETKIAEDLAKLSFWTYEIMRVDIPDCQYVNGEWLGI